MIVDLRAAVIVDLQSKPHSSQLYSRSRISGSAYNWYEVRNSV